MSFRCSRRVAAIGAIGIVGAIVIALLARDKTEAAVNQILNGPSWGPFGNYHIPPDAAKRIQGLGVSSIPWLIRAMDEASHTRTTLDAMMEHKWLPRWISARRTADWERSEHIVSAFRALGPVGASAIPELAKRLHRPETAYLAAYSLVALGPVAKTATSNLLVAAQSTNIVVKSAATEVLPRIHREAARMAGLE